MTRSTRRLAIASGLLLGSILLSDLCLLGLFGGQPLEALGPPLAAMALCGVLAAIVSGFIIFTLRPDAYLGNAAFLVKLVLLTLALANALARRLTTAWRNGLMAHQAAHESEECW